MNLAPLPPDYAERVYSGVLGKIIGVYLGRPFEQWHHDAVVKRFGEVTYYVHDQMGVPLIVSDDDISGTFTFVRALPDYGNSLGLTAAQIGQTWLNYIIEKKAILWWGGMGNSTEHTAYLRLKRGIPAPRSGSMALNGQVVAEQIGAQIFIDGWAMVAPGDPEFAADLGTAGAFRMGSTEATSVTDTNTLLMATTATIIAGTVDIGASSQHSGANTLTLGTGVTTIQGDTINIGSTQNLAEMAAASERGADLLRSQRFDVVEAHDLGDTAIARLTWTGANCSAPIVRP